MAITWTGAGGVFTRLGKLLKTFLAFEALQEAGGDLPVLTDEILDAYGDDRELVSGLFESMESVRDGLDTIKETLVAYAEVLLRSAADELDAPSEDLATLWPLFLEAMKDDAQSVDANAVDAGEVTPDEDNAGDGALIVSVEDVEGADVEILVAETVRVQCTADASSGAAEARELFRISGEVPAPSRASYRKRGTGWGDTFAVATEGFENAVANGTFEEFTTENTPDDWNVDAGIIGTHVFESEDEFRGAKCLRFEGDGVLGTIGVSQGFAANVLTPRTKYALGVRIKTSGLTQGTIRVLLAGTGYTPGEGEVIQISADWPTDWTLKTRWINTPAVLPDDMEIVVEVTGTPDDDASIWFDDVALVPAGLHAGLSLAIFAGADRFALGDSFTFSVTNDEAGTFQTLFGRLWGVQLPSDAEGSETIDDGLCE